MIGVQRPNQYVHYGYSGQMTHQHPMNNQWQQNNANRNQPFTYQAPLANYDWTAYQQQNPYGMQGYQPYSQNYQQGYTQQMTPYPSQPYGQKDSQFLFQNPLQPKEELIQPQSYMPMNGYPMMNPYPKSNMIPKQPGGVQSLLNSFKSQDGSVDFTKMVNTAGQMMNAVNQVSSLVKGFGGIFKA
jgi:hypothetical protein